MSDVLEGFIVPMMLICTAVYAAWAVIRLDILQSQAIENGYAQHCPLDGEFAWVGECEQPHE